MKRTGENNNTELLKTITLPIRIPDEAFVMGKQQPVLQDFLMVIDVFPEDVKKLINMDSSVVSKWYKQYILLRLHLLTEQFLLLKIKQKEIIDVKLSSSDKFEFTK